MVVVVSSALKSSERNRRIDESSPKWIQIQKSFLNLEFFCVSILFTIDLCFSRVLFEALTISTI